MIFRNPDNQERHVQGYLLKELTRQDLSALMKFDLMATFEQNDTPPDHAPPPFTIEELLEMFEKNEIFGGMFDYSENMVAYYIFDIREKELYIDSIAVHPQFRDRGIGSALLHLADTLATSQNLDKCTLSVDPFNGRGVKAYLKHGYQVIDFKSSYFGPNYPNTDRFWMEKMLRNPRMLETVTKPVTVSDTEGIEELLRLGFVGVNLIRADNLDNKANIITFQKIAS